MRPSVCSKIALIALLSMAVFHSTARAWGCKGHQTVALIAERYLTPNTRQYLDALLKDNPIDPQLRRYCGNFPGSALADSSTWPDDARATRNNGPWHYIDIPRGAPRAPLAQYCGDSGCVTQAIAEQLAILKDGRAEAVKRAEAVRYIVHFIGDLHMPLHATTNNDEGGNCVPVGYFRRLPQEHNHSFSPNLHAVWDTAIVERDMEGADPREYADLLVRAFARESETWQTAGIELDRWAWESHDLAESIAYGRLRPKDPVEKPVAVHSCTDDDNVGERLLQMHFTVNEEYQKAAGPVVRKRLAQAGIRLAMILNDAVSAAQRAP